MLWKMDNDNCSEHAQVPDLVFYTVWLYVEPGFKHCRPLFLGSLNFYFNVISKMDILFPGDL